MSRAERLIAEATATRLDCDCSPPYPVIRRASSDTIAYLIIHNGSCPCWNGRAQSIHIARPKKRRKPR